MFIAKYFYMNAKNYLKLNLPANPLKRSFEIESQRYINAPYDVLSPEETLSDEMLTTFQDMKLEPKNVVLFGRNNKSSTLESRVLHSDLALSADGFWRTLLFGINWEVTGSENVFSWWDCQDIKQAWPNELLEEDSRFKKLNGIHFIQRGYGGIPPGATKIDETVIDGPTLVRTDVPHMTMYRSAVHNRLGVSVRFNESQFASWNQIVEYFTPWARPQ